MAKTRRAKHWRERLAIASASVQSLRCLGWKWRFERCQGRPELRRREQWGRISAAFHRDIVAPRDQTGPKRLAAEGPIGGRQQIANTGRRGRKAYIAILMRETGTW